MKRMSAGAMIFDPDGKVLLIKSRVRGTWEWPAGRSEGNESPLQTCRREVREESGLDIEKYRFLGVNFQTGGMTKNGRLQFTFVAEISADVAKTVTPQPLEVSDFRWVDVAEAQAMIAAKLSRRFHHLLISYEQNNSIYMEAGEPI